MTLAPRHPVVHLELRTGDLPRACAFYTELFGWRAETVRLRAGTYVTLDLGAGIAGGVSEHDGGRPLWLPYVAVDDLAGACARARRLGASVVLAPREGPAGWRSVLAAPACGEIALWQSKG